MWRVSWGWGLGLGLGFCGDEVRGDVGCRDGEVPGWGMSAEDCEGWGLGWGAFGGAGSM